MKSIIFDTGPIISLTMNHLMWTLEPLKKQFGGEFYITQSVKEELIDKPLETRRFKFEALHTDQYIRSGLLTVYEYSKYAELAREIETIANHTFRAKENFVNIVHIGEMEVLALALLIRPDAVVIDERTTRELIEEPMKVQQLLERRLHTKVDVDMRNFKALKAKLKGISVIRSVELAAIAYEMGMLDRYLPDMPHRRETLLDSILWGIKLNGCAISEEDILEIIRIECS